MPRKKNTWPLCVCGDYLMPGHFTCGGPECEEEDTRLEPALDPPDYNGLDLVEIFNKGEEKNGTRKTKEKEERQ
jgi:hypothetical protein